uniref:Ubiquitin-like domain-containing protein n=1 Tax=Stegastes partitus TaxID=144197 RepID=A0A3B5A391_9TELE
MPIGLKHKYDVKPDEAVSAFKTTVESREGVAVSQQRLIHEGREMMEGTLADYKVREMSTIDMTMRLRGGHLTRFICHKKRTCTCAFMITSQTGDQTAL